MLKAIIIDDELKGRIALRQKILDYCKGVQILGEAENGEQGLLLIETHHPDIIFLDIEMPRMNGFEMLEQLNPISFSLIFTTSYDQYAIKAIRFSAMDYLLKPIDARELIAAVHKVQTQKYFPAPEQMEMLMSQVKHREIGFQKIAVPTAEGFELIPADQVVRCEANDNYTHLFLKDKKKIIACRTLKEMEAQLEDFASFLRVHHSYMVNMNEVVKYVRGEGGYLIMSDGTTVNVSRSRKDALLKFF